MAYGLAVDVIGVRDLANAAMRAGASRAAAGSIAIAVNAAQGSLSLDEAVRIARTLPRVSVDAILTKIGL